MRPTLLLHLPIAVAVELAHGSAYAFRDWPNPAVPTFGAGVYTIWHSDGRFIYVGMSGRGMTSETKRRKTPQGIYTRLQSHASGRRSGDQFCVYVADRLVLPSLSQEDIEAISSGRHQMDAFVRQFIHEKSLLSFRNRGKRSGGIRGRSSNQERSVGAGPPALEPWKVINTAPDLWPTGLLRWRSLYPPASARGYSDRQESRPPSNAPSRILSAFGNRRSLQGTGEHKDSKNNN